LVDLAMNDVRADFAPLRQVALDGWAVHFVLEQFRRPPQIGDVVAAEGKHGRADALWECVHCRSLGSAGVPIALCDTQLPKCRLFPQEFPPQFAAVVCRLAAGLTGDYNSF
jgi:hypothetical protein